MIQSPLKYLALFFILFLTLANNNAKATHAIGEEITYQCIGPNQYEITLSMYRDCSGINLPSTRTINWTGSCGSSNLTVTLSSPAEDITNVCPSQPTNCAGGSGSFGVQAFYYKGTITFPAGCSDIKLSNRICCRNNAITTLNNPGSDALYVETILQNNLSFCNSSPTFDEPPWFFYNRSNSIQIAINKATDPDGDSLHYKLVGALDNAGNPVNYSGGYNALNPFGVGQYIYLDSSNGDLHFIANNLIVAVLVIEVEEYRNGVLIGSVRRDIQVSIVNATNNTLYFDGFNTGTNPFNDTGCANTYNNNITITDPDISQSITITTLNDPSNNFIFSQTGTNPVNVNISLNPLATPTPGVYELSLTAQDDNCPILSRARKSLFITLNNYETVIDTIQACDSLTWIDGITYYTNNNTAKDTLNNPFGCDSIVKLNLTINNSSTGTDVITACDSLTWSNGITYYTNNNTAKDTLTNAVGCDSIVTLNLTINNSNSSTDVITACDSITWIDGITYYTNNNTAKDTLTNAVGCDSIITLNLTINNSNSSTDVITACDSITWIDGITYYTNNNTAKDTLTNAMGCDSIVTLNLTINSLSTGTDIITACDSLTWINGITYYTNNNTAKDTLTNTVGCDSIVTLNLTINNSTSSTDVISACDSLTWVDGITYYSNNNTAKDTLTNAVGCDSIVTLNLTINNSTSSTDVITACDSLTWIDGITYYINNNTAKDTLTNAVGCDSIVTLNLTINSLSTGTDVITTCDSLTWSNGITYYTNNNTAKDTLTNAVGCDSIVTLNLTINSPSSGTDVITACDSLTWSNGITYYTNNNTAKDTLTNAVGCDSIVTLNLTINSPSSGTDVITACDSITWINGITYYTNNNTAKDTLTNAVGCDSIVTLNLTINNSTSSTDVVTACDSLTWIDGITYYTNNNTAKDTLTNAVGCDSIVTLNLTINNSTSSNDVVTACDSLTWIDGITYYTNNNTAKDTLTNAVGCDSIVTLNLTINNSTSSTDVISACDSLTWINGITYYTNNNTAKDTLTNLAGCDSIVTLNLTVNNSQSNQLFDTICYNDSYTLPNNTLVYDSGIYYDTASNINGCDSITIINLHERPLNITTLNDSICFGDSLLINNIYRKNNGTYDDTLISSFGCDSIARISLYVISPIITNTNAVICIGDSIYLEGEWKKDAGNYSDTAYTTNGCLDITNTSLTVTQTITTNINDTICNGNSIFIGGSNQTLPGLYSDTLSSFIGCDSIIITNLTVLPRPSISGLNDTSIFIGASIPYNLPSGYSYFWTPGDYLSCNNCNSPISSPSENITYQILISNGSCDTTVSHTVTILEESNIFIPTMFSPNGDNMNDFFIVRGATFKEFNMKIFDRWGEKVFESTDYKIGWDGNFRGEKAETGAYLYLIEGTDFYGESINEKGNITLIR